MIVKVTHASNRQIDTYRGTSEQVLAQLLERFPWARRGRDRTRPHDPSSLRDVLARLSSAQDLFVESSDG